MIDNRHEMKNGWRVAKEYRQQKKQGWAMSVPYGRHDHNYKPHSAADALALVWQMMD